jgi:hypothetical protein
MVFSGYVTFFLHFAVFTLKLGHTKAKANVVLICGKSKNTVMFVEWHAPAYSFFYFCNMQPQNAARKKQKQKSKKC